MRSASKKYESRIAALKRRRDFLWQRADNHTGNPSYDLQEASAIDWALAVIEFNAQMAMDLIINEMKEKEK